MIKKIVIFLFLSTLVLTLSGCSSKIIIKLYNWGEYLDPSLKEKFNEQFKSKNIVLQEIKFDSNEMALTAIKSGNQYDLIIPSDYCIDELVNLNLGGKPYLQKLDWSKIGINKTSLDPALSKILLDFKNEKGYDILDYTIPYFWGNFGLLYNRQKISDENIKKFGWSILKQTKVDNQDIKVALYDSSTDLFTTALKDLGKSVLSSSASDINKAAQWMDEIPYQNRNYITDEIFDDMINQTYDVTPAYSGDASEIIMRSEEENTGLDLCYYIPEKGTNVWFDGIVMSSNACREAYEFLRFMYKEENNLQNATECGFASVVKNVLDLQASDDEISDKIKEIILGLRDEKKSSLNELQIYRREIKREIKFKWVVFRCK